MPDIATLLHAYHVAGRALDRAMRREGGATDAEWQAEDDARIALGSARRADVEAIRESIRESTAYQQSTAAGSHTRSPRPSEIEDEPGSEPVPRIYPACPLCGRPQGFS